MSMMRFGTTRRLGAMDFEAALQHVTAGLKEGGFGLVTELDFQAKLKEKIGVDFRRCQLLGACNPSLAHQALTHDIFVGLMLPCNVLVFEEDDGQVVVSVARPREMLGPAGDDPQLEGLLGEVEERLARVVDALGGEEV